MNGLTHYENGMARMAAAAYEGQLQEQQAATRHREEMLRYAAEAQRAQEQQTRMLECRMREQQAREVHAEQEKRAHTHKENARVEMNDFLQRASKELEKGLYQSAIDYYNEALKEQCYAKLPERELAKIYYYMGYCGIQLRHFMWAKNILIQALQNDPYHKKSAMLLSVAERALAQSEKAIVNLAKAREGGINDLHINALLAFEKGDWEGTVRWSKQLIQTDALLDEIDLCLCLDLLQAKGIALINLGKFSEAIAIFQKAKERVPNTLPHYPLLEELHILSAQAYRALNNIQAADTELQEIEQKGYNSDLPHGFFSTPEKDRYCTAIQEMRTPTHPNRKQSIEYLGDFYSEKPALSACFRTKMYYEMADASGVQDAPLKLARALIKLSRQEHDIPEHKSRYKKRGIEQYQKISETVGDPNRAQASYERSQFITCSGSSCVTQKYRLYKVGAELKHFHSLIALASLHYEKKINADGTPATPGTGNAQALARDLYRQANELQPNDSLPIFWFAMCDYQGAGIKLPASHKEYEKLHSRFTIAANKGNKEASLMLAWMCYHGQGIGSPNVSQAIQHAQLAGERLTQEDSKMQAQVQYFLGQCHAHATSHGGTDDLNAALTHLNDPTLATDDHATALIKEVMLRQKKTIPPALIGRTFQTPPGSPRFQIAANKRGDFVLLDALNNKIHTGKIEKCGDLEWKQIIECPASCQRAAIAINENRDIVLALHKNRTELSKLQYYMGSLAHTTYEVAWKEPVQCAYGIEPSVALTDDYIVEVHTSESSKNNLYANVGKIVGGAISWQTGSWSEHLTNNAKKSSVALQDNLAVVVAEKDTGDGVFYSIGFFKPGAVSKISSGVLPNYANPHISFLAKNKLLLVAQCSASSPSLVYRTGTVIVSPPSITWADNQTPYDWGFAPTATGYEGKGIAVHTGDHVVAGSLCQARLKPVLC